MTRTTHIPLAFAPLAALLLAACEVVEPGPQPATLEIDAPVNELWVGDTVQLSFLALADDGDTLADAVVQWSSSAPLVATVLADGRVVGLSAGTSTVVATLGNVSDTLEFTVVLGTVTIDASVSALAVGDSTQLTSLVLANGDTLADAVVQWSSLSPTRAIVSATGTVLGISPGTAIITARIRNVTDTMQLTVRLSCASVTPAGTLPSSGTSAVDATGMSCVRAGEAKTVRGYHLPLLADGRVQMDLSPVEFGDSIVIINAASSDTVVAAGTRLAGSGGSYYLYLNVTAELDGGLYLVWVMRDGAPTTSATLSSTAHALCRGASIDRSLAVNDSISTSHTTGSCLLDGTYAEGWEFTTTDTTNVSFSLALNESLIPHLVIADSAMDTTIGISAYTNDLTLDASVPPGTWRLWVTSPRPSPMYPTGILSPPTGYAFTLRRNAPAVACGAATTPIVLDAPIAGILNAADCVMEGESVHTRIDQYTFTVATETTYDFTLSASFFPAHFVRDSTGSYVMTDYTMVSTSLVTRQTLGPGTYTYIVRPAFSGVGGTYTATVTQP